MKKQLIQLAFIYVCLLISFNLFSQSSNFTLKGKIDSRFNDMPIMLFTFKADSIHSVDTTMIKNGSFVFHGNEYLKDEALLTAGNFPEEVISTYVFLEQGILS